jgi:hypothetical protein
MDHGQQKQTGEGTSRSGLVYSMNHNCLFEVSFLLEHYKVRLQVGDTLECTRSWTNINNIVILITVAEYGRAIS